MKQLADKEELLLCLDKNGNSTGKLEKRSIVHNKQIFHNEVALWIINGNDVLLERRSPNKKLNPNKLALCAGHVVEHETIEEALIKEAKEELGIDLTNYIVSPLMILKRKELNNYCFSHHFYIIADIATEEFKIQLEELTEVIYKPLDWVIKQMLNNTGEIAYKWSKEYKKLFKKLKDIIKNKNRV